MDYSAILLAAGQSSRFGAPKLLHPLANGTPLGIQSAINLQAVFKHITVVVNAKASELALRYQALGVDVVINPRAAEGLSRSIIAGIEHTPARKGWIIALADMPFIQSATLHALLNALQQGAMLAAPLYQGQRGHPVGFTAGFKAELLQLTGDKGAGLLLQRYANQLQLIAVNDKGVIGDIDTPKDLTDFNL